MALFCDFENVALGVRDAKYAQFDIKKVLERLLLKGSIVDIDTAQVPAAGHLGRMSETEAGRLTVDQ